MAAKTKTPKKKPNARVAKKSLFTKSKLNYGLLAIIAGVMILAGGLYVLLSQAATPTTYRLTDGTTIQRRFPGDPNPRVSGKAYIGADQLEATTYKSRFEDPIGKSMSTVRRFYAWGSNDKMANQAKEDIAANRLPMYSTKTPSWAEVAAGKYDTQIDDLLRKLDVAGGPVWLIVYHEPDGGGDSLGPKKEDDPGGAAAWVAMQKKVRARMNALGTRNIALMAAMTGGFGGDFHQPKDAWWADNTFDAFLLDHYVNTHTNTMAEHPYWKGFSQWAEKKGIPYGTAELGNRAGGQEGVGYYQATSDCNNLTARGLPASTVQKSADRLREFWNWGFDNKKDVIAHAYFDKCVNSGSSPWALGGQQLDLWRDILKNDPRVQRVKDLGTPTTATTSSTPTTTTTINPTTTISSTPSPSSSTSVLNVNITSPAAGKTVNGSINVTAGPETNLEEISFRLDGAWQTTDTEAPFSWSWDTTKSANGQHTLTIRARKIGDPGDVYTEKSITVNVSNINSNPTPSTDTTKPTAPSNVKGNIVWDAFRFSYYTNLSWGASTDNVGVTSYVVKRNGSTLGTPSATNFQDYGITANTIYNYDIQARDAAGNTSAASSARLVGRCFLIWCWAE